MNIKTRKRRGGKASTQGAHTFLFERGAMTMFVLVFMGILTVIVGAMSSYVFEQSRVGRAKYAREQAFQIAEAGLEYYRWFLAHNPGDLTDGTGSTGPYEHDVTDPEGGDVGTFSLSIDGNASCGEVQSIDIASEGRSDAAPQYRRTLSARYARPSVAEFAYIINSSVWAGADRTIVGPYHANGGIRMDGTNNSTVTSAVSTWTCTSSFGCNPSEEKPGIFGEGSGSSLWEYPVPQVDFEAIGVDFSDLSNLAQAQGLRFATAGGQDRRGYHLILRADNTVDVYRVTNTKAVWSIHIDDNEWHEDYHTILKETYVGRYTIPSDCAIIFVQDKVWLEGVVGGKVAVVAAHPGNPYNPDIIINGNISYANLDGSSGLVAIAENSILIPLEVPDDLSVRGIFVAQEGYFGRNLYVCWYSPYDQRQTLTMHGSVISNQRVGTKWGYSGAGCGSGQWSGFNIRNSSYDRLLALDPPPFTPSASPDERFILWREE